MRLARALDLVEKLAIVIRELAHDLIFARGCGSLVKSGNEVDFVTDTKFVHTRTSREAEVDGRHLTGSHENCQAQSTSCATRPLDARGRRQAPERVTLSVW